MTAIRLFYATNRAHTGRDRSAPTGYGSRFSADGIENLRFGVVSFEAEQPQINRCVKRRIDGGVGDGKSLAAYFLKQVKRTMSIRPYLEEIDRTLLQVGFRRPEQPVATKAGRFRR